MYDQLDRQAAGDHDGAISTAPPIEQDGCADCGDVDAYSRAVLIGSFTVKHVLMCDDCFEKVPAAEYLAAA